jgi:hypothetical protein
MLSLEGDESTQVTLETLSLQSVFALQKFLMLLLFVVSIPKTDLAGGDAEDG